MTVLNNRPSPRPIMPGDRSIQPVILTAAATAPPPPANAQGLAVAWGVCGFLGILASAIGRLAPIALQPLLLRDLTWVQWGWCATYRASLQKLWPLREWTAPSPQVWPLDGHFRVCGGLRCLSEEVLAPRGPACHDAQNGARARRAVPMPCALQRQRECLCMCVRTCVLDASSMPIPWAIVKNVPSCPTRCSPASRANSLLRPCT